MSILARPPWRRWFRRMLHRQAVQTMATALLDEGPDGDWRDLARGDQPAVALSQIGTSDR